MHQVDLVETRYHAHLEQQAADAGVPGPVNAVQPFKRTAELHGRQRFRPWHPYFQ
ncbi:hypothetical protein HX795_25235 [Pseudomonas edaphica]|uniref:Uncharacterized protein n=1 Tax=Pseudomonas edaphica TaxID=2006980 RepID=A0A7Y8FUM0_9PSED|nr:hypothetical protein [Pseudomonas edaphica]